MRTLLTLAMTGLAIAGLTLGYRVMAGNGDQAPGSSEPKTATPAPDEDEGYWTPERLKEAEPIEMPKAPWPPDATDESDGTEPGPSESGPGHAGSGETAPEDETTLIPGAPGSDTGDDTTR